MIRKLGTLGAAGLLLLASACGDDEEEAPVAPPSAETSPAAEEPAAEPAQPQAAEQLDSNFGTVSLNPGFVPDPKVVEGVSGGGVEASTLDAACAGWVAQTPDHILAAGGDFANMRILAHSEADITLVVQKPDGTYVCDDDTEGTNPVVATAAPQGNYKVWIGSYEEGANAEYKLGFSELEQVTPTQLTQ